MDSQFQFDKPESSSNRDAFIAQLPHRISGIEDNWSLLSAGGWDRKLLESLYSRIRELSEGSSRYDLFQLHESVFSVEVYLSSFIDATERPEQNQVDAIGGLLRALKSAATATATASQGKPAAENTLLVYLLANRDGEITELGEALTDMGAKIERFADPDLLVRALGEEHPRAILADTALLPRMGHISSELVRLNSQLSLDIPLVFVSTSNTLQLRVDAIRAGSDAYFVTPLDIDQVSRHIVDRINRVGDDPYRVMVVEDDPTQAEFAASILKKAGMEVMQVTEPMRVLDAIRHFEPDLIMMDIYMPDVNGIELTTIIREYNDFVTIPIVFLSGEQNTDKQLQALSVGGDDFIAKPIRPKHLQAVVTNRIRRSRHMVNALHGSPGRDPVSGVFSRRLFNNQVNRLLEAPTAGIDAAVLVVRPDNLDEVRRTLGVGGVDSLVTELAESVNAMLEDQDPVCRIDEQSIGVLIRRPGSGAISETAEHIRTQVEGHLYNGPFGKLKVKASIGVCEVGAEELDAAGLTKRATSACEIAQAEGGNRVHAYSVVDKDSEFLASQNDEMVDAIRDSLGSDSFIVRYQPLLDLQTRGSESYEIILRLPTPDGNQHSERRFRDAADSSGTAGDIDRWLLERAFYILKERRLSGRRTQIFARQSAASALDPNHPAWLLGRLRANQMVGTGLVLDFRLSDISKDLKTAHANIQALREMDVEICISRFPEKEAAFKVLRFLKAQYVSIAPRLLKADRDVISSFIEQAHKASARVIVSGVDDPRSIDLHWSSGADYLQGKFIQRPLENMDYDFSQVVI